MATSFEAIPLMGLFRIWAYSRVYALAVAAVLGPAVVLPAGWGLWASVRGWLRGKRSFVTAALALHALLIPFTPFSTFREPAAMVRFATGLVLAVLWFAARYRRRRILNYSWLWLVLNVMLMNH